MKVIIGIYQANYREKTQQICFPPFSGEENNSEARGPYPVLKKKNFTNHKKNNN